MFKTDKASSLKFISGKAPPKVMFPICAFSDGSLSVKAAKPAIPNSSVSNAFELKVDFVTAQAFYPVLLFVSKKSSIYHSDARGQIIGS